MSLLACCLPSQRFCRRVFQFLYSAEHFPLVNNVGAQAIHDIHSWKDHRQCAVRCSKLQLFSEVRNGSTDLFVLGIDSCAFLSLQILVVRGFDNAVLCVAMLNDAGETMFERSQPGETLQVFCNFIL